MVAFQDELEKSNHPSSESRKICSWGYGSSHCWSELDTLLLTFDNTSHDSFLHFYFLKDHSKSRDLTTLNSMPATLLLALTAGFRRWDKIVWLNLSEGEVVPVLKGESEKLSQSYAMIQLLVCAMKQSQTM